MSSSRELLESYFGERSLSVSPGVAKGERAYLKRFFRFVEGLGVTEVGELSFGHLDVYRRHLETTPGERGKLASRSYLRQIFSALRLFLVWSFETEHTLVDFTAYELPPTMKSVRDVPNVSQVRRLLETPDPESPLGSRDRLVLESFYTLGLRRLESHSLNVSSVSLSRGTVRVMGKGQVERLLPMSDRLCRLFHDYFQDVRPSLGPRLNEEALWVSSQGGGRLGYETLRHIVLVNARRARLGKMGPHLLRHACATHLLEGGAELEQVRRFLGHACLGTTQDYTQVSDEQLKVALGAAGWGSR